MSKPVINYVSLFDGRCGLTTDSKSEVRAQQGYANVRYVRPATEDEVAWVRAMGGDVPDGRIAKATEEQS